MTLKNIIREHKTIIYIGSAWGEKRVLITAHALSGHDGLAQDKQGSKD